jgi:hypothetical protein
LETVELQKPPEACWWSELYLWVACEGVLVKFPYYSTHSKVSGSGLEVCSLNFDMILGFHEGVLATGFRSESDNMISILKICDDKPFSQKIGDPRLPFNEVAISSDGCAVLLYKNPTSILQSLQYQLWEFARESGWKLHFDGNIGKNVQPFLVDWLSLTGTRSSRRSMWVGYDLHIHDRALCSFDFKSRELYEYSFDLPPERSEWVGDIAPDVLLIKTHRWMSVVKISDAKVITTLRFGTDRPDAQVWSDWTYTFYLLSKSLLLVVYENEIKHFKIHNIEN